MSLTYPVGISVDVDDDDVGFYFGEGGEFVVIDPYAVRVVRRDAILQAGDDSAGVDVEDDRGAQDVFVP